MKNLKKVLALVLAFACAFTMFAGAAFTDQADIKVDADVVDTLVSLGIVEGFEDGSFQPNGTVTRAQMAKMIYVLRTGKSDASAYNDDKTSFTDIGSHWARGYIKYCQSLGIIAGKSNTIFAPNATVTAQEAAKMLLVTLGYDATKAGLTGSGWAARTNALADENGLLEDVNTSFTGPCPRQYAAQLIYNALDTETVVWRDDAYTNENYAGTPNKTIGQKYMGLESNDTGVLAAVSKEDGKDTFRLTVNGLPSLSKVEKDYSSLLGQKVKVLYKETDKVYGVYATDDNLTVTTLVDDIDDADKTNGKFKVDGTEYKTNTTSAKAEETIKVYTTADLTGTKLFKKDGTEGTILKSIPVYETVTLIDNDDDDKIDFGVYTPFTFAKVTYKGTDSITLKAMGGTQFAGSKTGIDYDLKDDDVTLYDGAKKDDYVLVTEGAYTSTGYTNIVKATTVSGKVAARKTETVKVGETNTTVAKEVRVGTTWYKVANYKTNTDANKIAVDDEFDFYGVNGFVFFADKTAGSVSASNIAFVDKAAVKNYGTDAGEVILANLYFADGTSKKDVSVANVNDKDVDDMTKTGDEYTEATTVAKAMVAQRLYKYSVKSNGDYELTALSNDEKGSYDEYVTTGESADLKNKDGKFSGVTVGDDKASTVRFSDDAVVFVKDKDDVKVRTGKSVAAWKNHDEANNGYMSYICGLADKTSGNYYMGIGAVVLGKDQKVTGNSDVKYGMLVSDLSESKVDSTDYYNFTVWNGTKNVDVKVEQKDAYKTFAKNTFIAYTEVETVDNVTEIEIENGYKDAQITPAGNEVKTVANAVAVKSLDKDTISFYGINDSKGNAKEFDLSDDLVVIGVNTEDKKGVADVELDVADETAASTDEKPVYFKNAVFFVDDGDVVAVFVDNTGAMYDHTKNQKMDTAETK